MKTWTAKHEFEPLTWKVIRFHRDDSDVPGNAFDKGPFYDDEPMAAERRKRAIYDAYPLEPMHPAVLAHWEARGMKKELYDADHDQGKYSWSIFTPLDMKPDKKYALVYFCHGGANPNNLAETYGFTELAAAERFLICYPNNGGPSNDEVDTEFPRILSEIRRLGYPIDWERVYCVGFSSGSEGAAAAACTCTRECAAVGVLPGGQPFKDLQFYTGADYYASTGGLRLPGCFIGGSMDYSNYPTPAQLQVPPRPERAENLNIWLRDIAKIRRDYPVSLESIEACLHSDDPVKAELGLEFDKEYSFHVEGMDWVGGDFYGVDGAPVARMIRAIGARHIVWDSQAKLVWDYLKHFRRDQETGESIYDPVTCWGEK